MHIIVLNNNKRTNAGFSSISIYLRQILRKLVIIIDFIMEWNIQRDKIFGQFMYLSLGTTLLISLALL